MPKKHPPLSITDTTAPPQIHDILLELGRRGQAAFALLMASYMEGALEDLIKQRMPNLSNTLGDKLFSGFGPFASFSAKIDVAYAMNLVSNTLRQDLHVIREIRNEFAHPKDTVHFDLTKMVDLLKKFRDYDSKMDKYAFFGNKADQILAELNQTAQNSALAAFLRKGSQNEKT